MYRPTTSPTSPATESHKANKCGRETKRKDLFTDKTTPKPRLRTTKGQANLKEAVLITNCGCRPLCPLSSVSHHKNHNLATSELGSKTISHQPAQLETGGEDCE
ncbi:hypothetical protein BaRGS_00008461 [Batillaria attramentaria]|uniref:Uncharacterized protein n=1 Tax=Batillaria attramentaria TaxID=370345 RepID=A0ABD0LMK5_9CAEN